METLLVVCFLALCAKEGWNRMVHLFDDRLRPKERYFAWWNPYCYGLGLLPIAAGIAYLAHLNAQQMGMTTWPRWNVDAITLVVAMVVVCGALSGLSAMIPAPRPEVCDLFLAAWAGVFEEWLFRGILLPVCIMALPRVHALANASLIVSVLFVAAHAMNMLHGESWRGFHKSALKRFCISVLLCLIWSATGSLWVVMACHSAVNMAVMLPDVFRKQETTAVKEEA
jgi:membrane protease YdiL (CAAX protease family)